MSVKLRFVDTGLVRYEPMLNRQRSCFDALVDGRRLGVPTTEETIFLVEHEPVITLGRHADSGNLLVDRQMLAERGIDCVNIDRGGDITYHGPGQLVVYPIIDMTAHHLGVKTYVNLLEQAVIDTLADHGIKGARVEGATGVWIETGTPRERKICAIGIRCSHFVTMHGLALNVNTDLSSFDLINPCGFTDKGVTSMARELGHQIDMGLVKKNIAKHLISLLNHEN